MNSEQWLAHLISFDTTSRYSNYALIHYIQEKIRPYQLDIRLTHDTTQQKANLFITLPGFSNAYENGLVLSGHTDVVPVDGQSWDTPPFIATKKNGRIYGRGTSDMKGFLAVILSLLPRFLSLKLQRPLHLAFSYDEEIGCLGVASMIKDFQEQGIHPKMCIVGEPTQMKPVVAHKGIQAYVCRLQGLSAHSSLVPTACNAIEHAATLIQIMRAYSKRLTQQQCDYDFDVPFTTLTSNVIQGGTALNIVPDVCEFQFEFRHLPNMTAEAIINDIEKLAYETVLPHMQEEYSNAKIELVRLGSVPSFSLEDNSEIVQLAREITQDTLVHKVSYATEAGHFQQAGIETILCGPGSITEAHRANEFIAIEQLQQCENFLYEMVKRYCL